MHAYIQDLAGVAHDDIDPSVFGDDQKVHDRSCIQHHLFYFSGNL